MKKIYLSFVFVAILGFIGWQWGQHRVPVSQAASSCAINITKFDFKEYSPHPVDDILFTYHFIDPGDFLRAVQNGQLPFLTKTLSENDATLAISDIKEALCGMPDKCNPAALVLDLQCIKPDNSSASPFERARAARVER